MLYYFILGIVYIYIMSLSQKQGHQIGPNRKRSSWFSWFWTGRPNCLGISVSLDAP